MPDAVVIGAGHNGLACAAYLARAGLEVVVLEASDRVGGACVTEEIAPGWRLSTAADSLSLLHPAVVSELGLKLDVRVGDPQIFVPLEEGGGLLLWDDPDRRARAIAKVSPVDAEGDRSLVELFEGAARRLRPLASWPATRRQVRRALAASDVPNLFKRTIEDSIADLCEENLSSEVMRGLWASQGVLGSSAGPRTPGTAYTYLHSALGSIGGRPGVRGFVAGGMGAVTAALADCVRAAGGAIRLEAEVASVALDGGRRAGGVVLAGSGEIVEADAVCSSADPRRTTGLVPPEALAPEFVEDIDLLPIEGTVVKVNCALSGLPRFRGMGSGSEPGPEHLGRIVVAPSIPSLERGCRAAAEGRVAAEMYCEASIQSAGEPGLAPEGGHTLSVIAQWAPYRLSEGSWEERRESVGDLVLDTLARFAPGLQDLVEARVVLGPPDLEARFGLTGGHPWHGEVLPDWMWDRRPAGGWHRHRTPLAGLYMCGAGTHPGGGVSGAPGRNGARAVLEDRVAAGRG